MSNRAYQMPESLFKSEERREGWYLKSLKPQTHERKDGKWKSVLRTTDEEGSAGPWEEAGGGGPEGEGEDPTGPDEEPWPNNKTERGGTGGVGEGPDEKSLTMNRHEKARIGESVR